MKEAILHAKPSTVAAIGGLPFVAAIAAMAIHPHGGSTLFALSIYSGILLLLLWSWTVGLALNRRIPADRRPDNLLFRIAVIYVALYSGCFVFTLPGGAAMWLLSKHPLVFATMHLLAMVASGAMLHFVGSNLALAEGDPQASTWSTTLSLFSIGGILPVQQRVNRLFSEESANAR